jgi:alkylated DNA repair protein (DNA oxidative demethylase)
MARAPFVPAAPLFVPRMPKTGAPFSVRLTNCGELGWVSDMAGYRYQATHPETGKPWPPIPEILRTLWRDYAPNALPPQACLVNWYAPDARMGLHQDRDERDFSAPVLSVSLGDTAKFRLGGLRRTDPTRSFDLASGDVMLLSGSARLAFHGVDRVLAGTSLLLARPGRVNLTVRRVDPA